MNIDQPTYEYFDKELTRVATLTDRNAKRDELGRLNTEIHSVPRGSMPAGWMSIVKSRIQCLFVETGRSDEENAEENDDQSADDHMDFSGKIS